MFPSRAPGETDAISDSTNALIDAVAALDGAAAVRLAPDALAEADGAHVLVQYNPFSYGRWGFAPDLVARLARRRGRFASLSVMVHEPYVPVHDGRSLLMGAWQRTQLAALLGLSDHAFASTEAFRARIARITRTRVAHLPVGSNLPDARAARTATRRELGLADEDVAVAMLGTGHPSRLTAFADAALAAMPAPAVVLNLGAGAPPLAPGATDARVVTPGALGAERLAALIAAADLALMPFIDGASTRRTSLIAALQQEVAAVSTATAETEGFLRDGLAVAAVDDPAGYARAAAALAADPAARHRRARAGRAVFDRHFAWPTIAATLVNELRAGRAGR